MDSTALSCIMSAPPGGPLKLMVPLTLRTELPFLLETKRRKAAWLYEAAALHAVFSVHRDAVF